MALTYNQQRAGILDYLLVPQVLQMDLTKSGWEQTGQEREILKSALTSREALTKLLQPFKERCDRYYLFWKGISLLELAYVYLINEGREPKTIEETLKAFDQLDETQIRQLLDYLLYEEGSDKPFTDRLEEADLPDASKWAVYQFYRHPLENFQQLLELMREIVPLYYPFFLAAQAERDQLQERFDYQQLMLDAGLIKDGDQSSWGNLVDLEAEVLILSPLYVRFVLTTLPYFPNLPQFILITPGIDQALASRKTHSLDNVLRVIKVISDASRYQVLKELIREDGPSKKEIAADLGITAAAVSFHIQKMMSSGLLYFQGDSQDQIRYDLNRPLLKEVIKHLQDDFDL